jgi:hypothetical protein
MKIDRYTKLKTLIGQRLFWDDIGSRYVFERSGVVTSVFRRQVEFDDTQDYKSVSSLKNLRTVK